VTGRPCSRAARTRPAPWAQIRLAADAGVPDKAIATSLGVGGSTVYRAKRRFVEGNLERALNEDPRPAPSASCPARRKPGWWPRG
jgi:hypothetical protein